mmetsp:Transcript_21718/g.56396  ORF Transcript_21718/g.56396 Transcript_21718/m.56396 type:complete len:205 (-) Transcript_21718:241-855(-)
MDHFLGSMSQPIDWKSLLNFSELNSRVKSHLTKVYATLAVALLSAAVGSYCQIAFHLPAMLFQFGFVLSTVRSALCLYQPCLIGVDRFCYDEQGPREYEYQSKCTYGRCFFEGWRNSSANRECGVHRSFYCNDCFLGYERHFYRFHTYISESGEEVIPFLGWYPPKRYASTWGCRLRQLFFPYSSCLCRATLWRLSCFLRLRFV